MLDWLELNGYALIEVEKWKWISNVPVIAVGKSPRGVYHSVIYKVGKMIHAPNPSKAGIQKPEWYYIISQRLIKKSMSAYEGSKMQENDENKKQGFLGHIKEAQQGKSEVTRESKLEDESLRDIYYKASKLEYDDFKGWFKGQGYLLSRKEL